VVTGTPGFGKTSFVNDCSAGSPYDNHLTIAWASFEQEPQRDHRRALRSWFCGQPEHTLDPEQRYAADRWIEGAAPVPDPRRGRGRDAGVAAGEDGSRRRHATARGSSSSTPGTSLEHDRHRDESETEYIGRAIRTLKRFAKAFQVHICVVAHPTKSVKDGDGKYKMPTLYDINGSANWYNKADLGVIVHRENEDRHADQGPEVPLPRDHRQARRGAQPLLAGPAALHRNREDRVMARRNKPHDPSKAAQVLQERKDRKAELQRLQAQGATLTLDKAGRIISAYRSNCFNLLLQRGSITPNQHDAAYTLAKDWAAWKGLDGKPETYGETVDGGQGCHELITDRMIRGGNAVSAAFHDLNGAQVALLTAFMVATVEEDRPMDWRGIVERVTGETVRDRQTVLVVGALESLRCIYQEPDRAAA
jgi:hypothetical protein